MDVGEVREGARGMNPACDGDDISPVCFVQPTCAPDGERSGERRGGGVDMPISILEGGTDLTGEVIALGRNRALDDVASDTSCTGLWVSLSTD